MAIFKVKKRNWIITTFERQKIEKAIEKAIKSVWWNDFSEIVVLVNQVEELLNKRVWKNIPDVETIQDIVEEVLIKNWHDKVAKSYIIYRQKRFEVRQEKKIMVDVIDTMEDYLWNLDRRINENANVKYSIWWLILKNSEKITANYWLSKIYPDEIWNAHRNADYHIHDLWMFDWYCAWWSLRQLLEEWLNWVPEKVESDPPKNLQSAVNQMVNFLWILQNERAWAQAFSSFDTYLSPFVHKYSEKLKKDIEKFWMEFSSDIEKQKYIDEKTYKYTLQNMQNFIFWLNVPSRRWSQAPFTNITLDWVCPDDLKEKSLMLWWVKSWFYEKKFWELEKEMKIINKALMEVYLAWDSKWRVFTFPIPTYNITEDFDRDDPLTDLLFEMTAKYWIPYFQNFIWSQYIIDEKWNKVRNPNAYEPWAVRSMCCRLQLDLNELKKRWGGLFWSAEMTWSVWVVTLNMARIWYNFKWDEDWFLRQVKYLMDLAKSSLEIKRKEITKRLNAWLFPYTKRYLWWFRNHFSTIWLNWLNEAILNFTEWKENISTKWWLDFAKKVMNYMRDILKQYQEETWNLYNLEATPAEWTTYRFAKEDKKQLKWIIQSWTEDAPYYTNSSQLPVWFTSDPFEALDYQDELQTLYTWGTVLHLYLWERLPDSESCKALVKKAISNYRLPYISITPTFSICPKHWYISWEHDYCPICDAEIWYTWKKYDIETRSKYTDDNSKLDGLKEKNV